MAARQHHIAKHPSRRLDVEIELQVAPVLTPVLPQLVPGFAAVELPQIDQIAQRHGIGAHRAGRQEGRSLLVLAQRGYFVQGQIQRFDPFAVEATTLDRSASTAGGLAGPLRGMSAKQRGAGR